MLKKLNLQDFLNQRNKLNLQAPVYRNLCTTCMHPEFSCYCDVVVKFDPCIQFVILIHPIEFHRRIATGRMSHLCLQGSYLIRGHDYSEDLVVNKILQDEKNHCVILYPSKISQNLSNLSSQQKKYLFPQNKKLTVFVIDGTWATARQMLRQSQNLQNLPRISFTPTEVSRFRVRKQPNPVCLSTIEAIYQVIDLVGPGQGFDTVKKEHQNLLRVFDYMVEQQIQFNQRSS